MADFCSRCEPDGYDIDLANIALGLKPGYSSNFMCESCEIRGVYKDESGLIYLAISKKGQIELTQVFVEDLLK